MNKLLPTIGIEVHCELKTKNKVFSNSLNVYGEIANTNINEIDLGYPGTLPTLNKDVIDVGIKTALLLNCKVNKSMYFDRKNYFYPDNPKNYQITQKSTPIGYDGFVEIDLGDKLKKIYIEEMHIEEDTCKSIHENGKTLLDFNRAGVPLIEIVTKPVIDNDNEAVLYVEKLREILLYGGISDVKIEEGSLRCDVNISLRREDCNVLGTKVEIKNIGSISAIKEAILFEIERQEKLINNSVVIVAETRKFDESIRETVSMRLKETNNDYRYFPEPDIPRLLIEDSYIEEIKKTLPILPSELRIKYKELGINDITINALISNMELNKYLLDLISMGTNAIIGANIITGDLLAYLNKNGISIKDTNITIDNLKCLVDKLESNEISSKIGKIILSNMFESSDSVDLIMEKNDLKLISDENELLNIIKPMINDEIKIEYSKNNEKTIKYLIGEIMKVTKGKANPVVVNDLLSKELSK
ncbi:MAG: Asp-tRNA(Asn)/Glu-tRNA(Gln) amidotransferase subunit GatB [Bacilli bacterium]|nr:Asp-tRNA(Asn)/Glu-tRNA(Gln) amidotransferase subunit GatB [Bacilli bacterium]